METAINKKPIAPILMKLKVGQVERYPVCRFTSVSSTTQRLHKQHGVRFSTATNDDEIFVLRIK